MPVTNSHYVISHYTGVVEALFNVAIVINSLWNSINSHRLCVKKLLSASSMKKNQFEET